MLIVIPRLLGAKIIRTAIWTVILITRDIQIQCAIQQRVHIVVHYSVIVISSPGGHSTKIHNSTYT